jgi:hypothetical protein
MRVWSCIHRLAGKVVEHFGQCQFVPGLLATPSPAATCLDTSPSSWIFRSVPAGILLLSIKRLTIQSARDSRLSDELKYAVQDFRRGARRSAGASSATSRR